MVCHETARVIRSSGPGKMGFHQIDELIEIEWFRKARGILVFFGQDGVPITGQEGDRNSPLDEHLRDGKAEFAIQIHIQKCPIDWLCRCQG